MNLLQKFRETAWSVLPVMGLVLALGLLAVPEGAGEPWWLGRFLVGGALLVAGLTVFLIGVDLGIRPMGERCGAALTAKRSLALLLGAAFVVGLVVTAAEPDIQVFGDQVRGVFPAVRKAALTFSIAGGVGLFMALGMLRTTLGIPLKAVLAASYAALFLLAAFAPAPFVGVAFDSGGATTGPMTVPFILALGIGVAAVRARGDGDGGFGLTGIASVGPVAAVLVYSLLNANVAAPHAESAEYFEFHAESAENAEPDSHAEFAESAESLFSGGGSGEAEPPPVETHAENAESASRAAATPEPIQHSAFGIQHSSFFSSFAEAFPEALRESLSSIAPLFGLFLVFQFALLKMTLRQALRISIGFVWAFLGLAVFLAGVDGGFMQAGRILGAALGGAAAAGGFGPWALLIGTGLAFGAVIVCAEPAVWVLSEQVEEASGGAIRRRTLLVFLSVGTALAIGLAMWRAVAGFPLWRILLPGYALALLLLARTPQPFSGIAFDSGGVASGPLTSTFVLSFTLGAASAGGGGSDSFGVIALVAMMPLPAIQLMGILVERKRRRSGAAADGGAPAPRPAAPDPATKGETP